MYIGITILQYKEFKQKEIIKRAKRKTSIRELKRDSKYKMNDINEVMF
jgi:hypothetical protein